MTEGLYTEAVERAKKRLDGLAKPPGSLGRLEELAWRLAGITGEEFPDVSKRCIIITAADNGVCEEGVSSAPQSFTYTQTMNFTRGLTGVCVLASKAKSELIVADVGVCDKLPPPVLSFRAGAGTANIAKGPAMTSKQFAIALEAGRSLALIAKKRGFRMIGAGEMGIGNTTTATAVLCALTGEEPEKIAGRGAGLTDEGLKKKISVIEKALDVNKPDKNDPADVIAKVGGFDIAAMTGIYIGAMENRLPAVVDGYISTVAALCAYKLEPVCREFMLPSHASHEPGAEKASQALGIKPLLDLDMRLGEGSGCPFTFMLADCACAVLREMATFEEACVDTEYVEAAKKF